MAKILLFSDLHIHNYQQYNDDGRRLSNCLDVLDLVYENATLNGCAAIVFAGDLFDQRKQIATTTLVATLQRFESLFKKHPDLPFLCALRKS